MWLLAVEWGLTGLGAAVFLGFYGWPGKYQDTVMSWHVASVTAVAALEGFGLLLAALGAPLPLWLFALIYGVATGIVWWRLWLLLRSRRRAPVD